MLSIYARQLVSRLARIVSSKPLQSPLADQFFWMTYLCLPAVSDLSICPMQVQPPLGCSMQTIVCSPVNALLIHSIAPL